MALAKSKLDDLAQRQKNFILENFVNKAIEQARSKVNPSNASHHLLFDPQGRVLIDVALSAEDKEEFRKIFGHDPAPLTTVSLDVTGIPDLNTLYMQAYKLDVPPLTDLSKVRGSIIPLQQEIHFHLALAARTYTQAYPSQFSEEIMKKAHQEAMLEVQQSIQGAFAAALVQATKRTKQNITTVDDVTLIQELDKARQTISVQAQKILVEKIQKLTKASLSRSEVQAKNLKHFAETTTATPNDLLHIDQSLGLTTFISGSEVTAHNRGNGSGHLADRQISTFPFADIGRPARLQIRTPSLDVKGDISPQEAIADVADKLDHLKNKYRMAEVIKREPKVFTYNLHTAINDRVDDLQGKNQQSQGARFILSGAHEYNARQLSSKEPIFCLVQNISVNGFGESLSYAGNALRTEATLMTELSMLYHLSANNDLSVQKVLANYRNYLQESPRTAFFSESAYGRKARESIEAMKQHWMQDSSNQEHQQDPLDRAKGALKIMMANNMHHQHQYAKLVQSLSIFIEEASIAGCKSGNERAQAINGRVAVLDSESVQANSVIFQAIDALAKAKPANVSAKTMDLKQKLDKLYDLHLQSAPSLISLADQGGAAKVNASKGFSALYNRNYAEESTLDHLSQNKAGQMQAHKGLTKSMISAWPKEPKKSWLQSIKEFFDRLIDKVANYFERQGNGVKPENSVLSSPLLAEEPIPPSNPALRKLATSSSHKAHEVHVAPPINSAEQPQARNEKQAILSQPHIEEPDPEPDRSSLHL